jgi:protein-L-isoaspartate(D-aspartate) O-methyltransferase
LWRLAAVVVLGACGAACSARDAGEGSPIAAVGDSATVPAMPSADPLAEQREAMVETGVVAWGVTQPEVVQAMRSVRRHEFVPPEYLSQAYENHPLPIGYGQTISQPYIVALMTQELDLQPGERVLEIGTGSGYQAAVLAELGVEVYSIEIVEPLAMEAEERLRRLGYTDIFLRQADGYEGWLEAAPFDAIVVTAAPDHVPQPLLLQLAVGGVLVIPVGPVGGYQELWRITRTAEAQFDSASLGGVRFVPLVREEQGD